MTHEKENLMYFLTLLNKEQTNFILSQIQIDSSEDVRKILNIFIQLEKEVPAVLKEMIFDYRFSSVALDADFLHLDLPMQEIIAYQQSLLQQLFLAQQNKQFEFLFQKARKTDLKEFLCIDFGQKFTLKAGNVDFGVLLAPKAEQIEEFFDTKDFFSGKFQVIEKVDNLVESLMDRVEYQIKQQIPMVKTDFKEQKVIQMQWPPTTPAKVIEFLQQTK